VQVGRLQPVDVWQEVERKRRRRGALGTAFSLALHAGVVTWMLSTTALPSLGDPSAAPFEIELVRQPEPKPPAPPPPPPEPEVPAPALPEPPPRPVAAKPVRELQGLTQVLRQQRHALLRQTVPRLLQRRRQGHRLTARTIR
jgi:type IV secretory pathway VirB10-like protein